MKENVGKGKRGRLHLILAVIVITLLAAMFDFPMGTPDASAAAKIERDVCLALDYSGSMTGVPLDKTKEAAKKFCDSILSDAQSDGRVAIVIFGSNVQYLDFTSDSSQLKTFIDDTYDGGGTCMAEALDEVSVIMQGARANSKKSVVVMADGQPNGRTYSGTNPKYPLYSSDSEVYNVAWTSLKDYNRYAIGFFDSVGDITQPSQLLNDICNDPDNNYKLVKDVDSLVYAFGEQAKTIVEETEPPIIIIPGTMGSRLFDSNDFSKDPIWPPSGDFTKDNLDDTLSMNKTVYVRPMENQQNLAMNEREYGAVGVYKGIVDKLCAAFVNGNTYREVYLFSYDFRQSISDSAKKLKEEIDKLGVDYVDIVAHSMGGLVASKYYSDNPDKTKINKVITCGTPYEGAPELIIASLTDRTLRNDSFENVINNIGLRYLKNLTPKTKKTFPSVAQLAPTENYCKSQPMYEKKSDFWGSHNTPFTFASYSDAMANAFGKKNWQNAIAFHKDLHDNSGDRELMDYENSYYLYGVEGYWIGPLYMPNFRTITAVARDKNGNWTDLKYGDGDGTVPLYSANSAEALQSLQGAQSEKLYSTNHGETISSEDAMKKIVQVLSGKDLEGKSTYEIDKGKIKYIVLRIACPVDVTIDYKGQTLTSDPDNFSPDSDFGRLDPIGEDGEIKMLSLDANSDYDIVMNGTGKGTMDYSIRFFEGEDTLKDERVAVDVPITDKTIIHTGSDESKDTILEVDSDGDGKVDKKIKALNEKEYNASLNKKESGGDNDDGDDNGGGDKGKFPWWGILIIALSGLAIIISIIAVAVAQSAKKRKSITKLDSSSAADIPPSADSMGAAIVQNGADTGKAVMLSDGEAVVIGKDSHVARLALSSSYQKVSRQHCKVTYSAAQNNYTVEDCSSNGTYRRDGSRLPKGKPTPVSRNTILRLADKNCEVLLD